MKIEDLKSLYRDIPPALQRLLKARGHLDCEDWDLLFRPKLSQLKNPTSIHQMDVAVARLLKAFKENESILIYGDFDLDGSSGVALLYSGFKALGFKHLHHIQPKRLTEGYGFHKSILDSYKGKVNLVITVDVGITGREAALHAKEIGMDVIITDHHLQEGELPEALAVLNPNKFACKSGLKHLCGVGVGYYLILATWMKLKEEKLISETAFDPKSILDFFVIGTISDLVPLINENRVLVKHGLGVLEKTKRSGLRVLLQHVGLSGKKLSSSDIGYKLAPKLNALSRMDKELLPVHVLLCQDHLSAERMVEQVLALNSERSALQKKAEALALEKERESTEEFCWVYESAFHKGIIGLVATRLSQTYLKPSFVGSVKDGKISGSARVPEGQDFNLVEILASCPSLKTFGGHAQAAGFELEVEKAELFKEELKVFFRSYEHNSSELSQNMKYDVEVSIEELTSTLLSWIQKLEPFGMGFEAPVFKITNVKVDSIKVLKEAHLKLSFKPKQESGLGPLQAIWFNHHLTGDELDSLWGKRVNVLGSLEWNEFMGRKNLQFQVKNLFIYEN